MSIRVNFLSQSLFSIDGFLFLFFFLPKEQNMCSLVDQYKCKNLVPIYWWLSSFPFFIFFSLYGLFCLLEDTYSKKSFFFLHRECVSLHVSAVEEHTVSLRGHKGC